MFEIFEQLVLEQSDEIFGVSQNQLGKFSMETGISGQWWRSHQSLACKGLCIQILCYVLERWIRTQHQILLGNDSWICSKIHHNTELWTQLMENRWNSSGNISQDSLHCISSTKSKSSWTKWATQHNSRDELSSCRCSMTWHGEKTMKRNVLLIPHLSLFAKRFPAGRWSFLGPGSETKWYSTDERPGGEWDKVAELMMIKFGESGHPVFRATSPFSRGMLKSTGGGKLSFHSCADGDTIETVCRTIISVNQLSIYGAISDLCDEYSACQTRTRRPVVAGQSDPIFKPASLLTMTPTPSIEIPAQENYCKTSDISWVHFATRWKNNCPKRLDSREHQKLGPC